MSIALLPAPTAAETTTYSYNALGERIKKRNQNDLQAVFLYGNNGELLYEEKTREEKTRCQVLHQHIMKNGNRKTETRNVL